MLVALMHAKLNSNLRNSIRYHHFGLSGEELDKLFVSPFGLLANVREFSCCDERISNLEMMRARTLFSNAS
jgi:hypothetical protein